MSYESHQENRSRGGGRGRGSNYSRHEHREVYAGNDQFDNSHGGGRNFKRARDSNYDNESYGQQRGNFHRGGRGGRGRFNDHNFPRRKFPGNMVERREPVLPDRVALAKGILTRLGDFTALTSDDDVVESIKKLADVFVSVGDLRDYGEDISDIFVKCFSTLSVQTPIIATLLALIHHKACRAVDGGSALNETLAEGAVSFCRMVVAKLRLAFFCALTDAPLDPKLSTIGAVVISSTQEEMPSGISVNNGEDGGSGGIMKAKIILRAVCSLANCGSFALSGTDGSLMGVLDALLRVAQPLYTANASNGSSIDKNSNGLTLSTAQQMALYLIATALPWCVHLLALGGQSSRALLEEIAALCERVRGEWVSPYSVGQLQAVFHSYIPAVEFEETMAITSDDTQVGPTAAAGASGGGRKLCNGPPPGLPMPTDEAMEGGAFDTLWESCDIAASLAREVLSSSKAAEQSTGSLRDAFLEQIRTRMGTLPECMVMPWLALVDSELVCPLLSPSVSSLTEQKPALPLDMQLSFATAPMLWSTGPQFHSCSFEYAIEALVLQLEQGNEGHGEGEGESEHNESTKLLLAGDAPAPQMGLVQYAGPARVCAPLGYSASSSWLRARFPLFDSSTSPDAATVCSTLSPLEKFTAFNAFQDILLFFTPIANVDGSLLGSVKLMTEHLLAVFRLFPRKTTTTALTATAASDSVADASSRKNGSAETAMTVSSEDTNPHHLEYILVEMLFQIVCQSPQNGSLFSCVCRLILELCKKNAPTFPVAVALAMNALFQIMCGMEVEQEEEGRGDVMQDQTKPNYSGNPAVNTEGMDLLTARQIADWFVFHLVNTQFSWPEAYWNFWMEEYENAAKSSIVRFFLQYVTRKCSRYCIPEKLRSSLPAQLHSFIVEYGAAPAVESNSSSSSGSDTDGLEGEPADNRPLILTLFDQQWTDAATLSNAVSASDTASAMAVAGAVQDDAQSMERAAEKQEGAMVTMPSSARSDAGPPGSMLSSLDVVRAVAEDLKTMLSDKTNPETVEDWLIDKNILMEDGANQAEAVEAAGMVMKSLSQQEFCELYPTISVAHWRSQMLLQTVLHIAATAGATSSEDNNSSNINNNYYKSSGEAVGNTSTGQSTGGLLSSLSGQLDRYTYTIRALADTEESQLALVSVLAEAYGVDSAMFHYALSEMMRRAQISVTAAARWLANPPDPAATGMRVPRAFPLGLTHGSSLLQQAYLAAHVESIVDRSIDFVKAALALRAQLGAMAFDLDDSNGEGGSFSFSLAASADLSPSAEPEPVSKGKLLVQADPATDDANVAAGVAGESSADEKAAADGDAIVVSTSAMGMGGGEEEEEEMVDYGDADELDEEDEDEGMNSRRRGHVPEKVTGKRSRESDDEEGEGATLAAQQQQEEAEEEEDAVDPVWQATEALKASVRNSRETFLVLTRALCSALSVVGDDSSGEGTPVTNAAVVSLLNRIVRTYIGAERWVETYMLPQLLPTVGEERGRKGVDGTWERRVVLSAGTESAEMQHLMKVVLPQSLPQLLMPSSPYSA